MLRGRMSTGYEVVAVGGRRYAPLTWKARWRAVALAVRIKGRYSSFLLLPHNPNSIKTSTPNDLTKPILIFAEAAQHQQQQ